MCIANQIRHNYTCRFFGRVALDMGWRVPDWTAFVDANAGFFACRSPSGKGVIDLSSSNVGRTTVALVEPTPLMDAVDRGAPREVVVALARKFGRMVHCKPWPDNDIAMTALMRAALAGQTSLVAALLPFEGGTILCSATALFLAALAGHVACVSLLMPVEAGFATASGTTALMAAAQSGQAECIALLLTAEAGMRTSEGKTALMFAAEFGFDNCVSLLLPAEAGLTDHEGRNALTHAVHQGHLACADLLVHREALLVSDAPVQVARRRTGSPLPHTRGRKSPPPLAQ
jgi:hypothetical protein